MDIVNLISRQLFISKPQTAILNSKLKLKGIHYISEGLPNYYALFIPKMCSSAAFFFSKLLYHIFKISLPKNATVLINPNL